MYGRIPDSTLEAVRARINIVELVSSYVTLKRTGRSYQGLCPFHDEKSPSFSVNEERGLFHCFGCGAGGTAFSFLMRIESLSFKEAAEALAKRVGVEIPRSSEERRAEEDRSGAFEISSIAQRFYAEALRSPVGSQAREYLLQRGISAASVEGFGLGFCPAGNQGARIFARERNGTARALEVGLLGRRADGTVYEKFRGRLMFPIRDSTGRVVGFGGRTLSQDQPKYLNSQESAVFRKANLLYGLFEAQAAIRKEARVVLVEGYLDVISLAQNGIEYCAASLGTALGVNQLRLARRFAGEIVAFFDGDRAGRNAAVRAFRTCVEADVWGLAAFLPEGFDPDTFVRKYGPEGTRDLLAGAVPLAEFFLDRHVPPPNATVPERVRAAKAVCEVLSLVKEPAQFDLLAKTASQRLGVDESFFRAQRQEGQGQSRADRSAGQSRVSGDRARPAVTTDTSLRPEEATLVEMAFLDRSVAHLVEESRCPELFESRPLAEVLTRIIEHWERGVDPTIVLPELPPQLSARITAALMGHGPSAANDRLAVGRDCIERLRKRTRLSRMNVLRAELQRAEVSGDAEASRVELRRIDEALRGRVRVPQ